MDKYSNVLDTLSFNPLSGEFVKQQKYVSSYFLVQIFYGLSRSYVKWYGQTFQKF